MDKCGLVSKELFRMLQRPPACLFVRGQELEHPFVRQACASIQSDGVAVHPRIDRRLRFTSTVARRCIIVDVLEMKGLKQAARQITAVAVSALADSALRSLGTEGRDLTRSRMTEKQRRAWY